MARPCYPDPACRLPDEYGMLASVLAAPGDDLPKLVYADWLQERDDPRGPFLRRWRAGDRTPPPDGVSASWLSVIGYTLDLDLERFGHPAWGDAVRRTAAPGVYVRTVRHDDDPLPPGASRLGGRPDLHPDAEWVVGDGGPLTFVAQWNAEELAGSPVCRALPKSGLFSLFVELDPVGVFADGRVLFTPTLDGLAERKHASPELAACRVEFVEWMTLPPPYSAKLDRHKLTPAAFAEYAKFFARFPRPAGAVHQLLGHATPTQAYPKSGCEADWTLLVELGGDEQAGLTAAGGGRWCFLIHEGKLREGQFDEACLEYQTQ